jgi:AAA ATPase containing von Willebrand factor type A (vWA) domain
MLFQMMLSKEDEAAVDVPSEDAAVVASDDIDQSENDTESDAFENEVITDVGQDDEAAVDGSSGDAAAVSSDDIDHEENDAAEYEVITEEAEISNDAQEITEDVEPLALDAVQASTDIPSQDQAAVASDEFDQDENDADKGTAEDEVVIEGAENEDDVALKDNTTTEEADVLATEDIDPEENEVDASAIEATPTEDEVVKEEAELEIVDDAQEAANVNDAPVDDVVKEDEAAKNASAEEAAVVTTEDSIPEGNEVDASANDVIAAEDEVVTKEDECVIEEDNAAENAPAEEATVVTTEDSIPEENEVNAARC